MSGEAGLLLDLSGDAETALRWASRQQPATQIRVITKADIRWRSKLSALALLRSHAPKTFWIFTRDLRLQSSRRLFILFAAATGARRIVMGDGTGALTVVSRAEALFREAPLLLMEFIIGYAVVAVSWVCTLLLDRAIVLGRIARAGQTGGPSRTGSYSLLYIAANPMSTDRSGGMASHVSGFIGGARALGHNVTLIAGACSAGSFEGGDLRLVRPSIALSATRAVFELWNNLVFTAAALRIAAEESPRGHFDLIYQRYNRFNWTGVVLSSVTGIPLFLEFNGSEVWVARHWDPVDQRRLLRQIERLNLAAARSIVVVSDALRRSLVEQGLTPGRILVNPNGVNTDEFRPDCGGGRLRHQLGIAGRIVVGFTGSFGPWHGTRVLAEAARLVGKESNCHFLFVGEGDEKAATEAEIAAAGARITATFTGHVAHQEVPTYLDACDILVSPHVPLADGSEFFGSPTKLFEYLAMAKPVIASRLGQIAEVIQDGENGVLVEPGDPHALADEIRRLAADPVLRARLGAAARLSILDKHTWICNAARVVEAFEKDGRR